MHQWSSVVAHLSKRRRGRLDVRSGQSAGSVLMAELNVEILRENCDFLCLDGVRRSLRKSLDGKWTVDIGISKPQIKRKKAGKPNKVETQQLSGQAGARMRWWI